MESKKFDQWCILEVMGHQKFAGRVSEEIIAGSAFVRIDIPTVGDQPGFSKLFGASSIYCFTPTTEAIARAIAERLQNRPIEIYDLPEEWRDKIRQPRLTAGQDAKCGHGDDHEFDDDEPRGPMGTIRDNSPQIS
jgi:hypothetical protein